jgi:hypothetical protein
MPVSFVPLILPIALVGIPLLLLLKSKKACIVASVISVAILSLIFLSVYVPGWLLMRKAHGGDPAAIYELARWTENHDERIGEFTLWPFRPNVLGGYALLEKAAAADYPPALYALGVRLKYGDHVPRPPGWKGPGGNVFPQPERGQALIDKAIELGYEPTIKEAYFYFLQYRKRRTP